MRTNIPSPYPIPSTNRTNSPSLIFLRPPLPPKLLTCANRPNLLEAVELHSKVMRGARAKTVLGAVLDGALLCGVAHSYVDRINEGRVPVIETALVRVMRVCTPPPTASHTLNTTFFTWSNTHLQSCGFIQDAHPPSISNTRPLECTQMP